VFAQAGLEKRPLQEVAQVEAALLRVIARSASFPPPPQAPRTDKVADGALSQIVCVSRKRRPEKNLYFHYPTSFLAIFMSGRSLVVKSSGMLQCYLHHKCCGGDQRLPGVWALKQRTLCIGAGRR